MDDANDKLEFYKSPSFQFYADDFVADTMDLNAEEIGAYMLLICRQWKKSFIPGDVKQLSRIMRVSPRRAKVIWATLASRFEPHPVLVSSFIQPRLERVRAQALAYRIKQAENGKKGGRPANPGKPNPFIWDKPNESQTQAKKSSPDSSLLTPSNTDSLRSSAMAVKAWPQDVDSLKRLAVPFLQAFANCRKPEALKKHGPGYVDALAIMRSRNVTIEQAWQAFTDAFESNGGKPLFGASAKRAVSFLPTRSAAGDKTPRSVGRDLSQVTD